MKISKTGGSISAVNIKRRNFFSNRTNDTNEDSRPNVHMDGDKGDGGHNTTRLMHNDGEYGGGYMFSTYAHLRIDKTRDDQHTQRCGHVGTRREGNGYYM